MGMLNNLLDPSLIKGALTNVDGVGSSIMGAVDPRLITDGMDALGGMFADNSGSGNYLGTSLEKTTNSGKDALGGAVSGAVSGSSFGPWGAAAGALIGGASSYFMNEKENREIMDRNKKKVSYADDQALFKSEYDSRFDSRQGNVPVMAYGGGIGGAPQGGGLIEYGGGTHQQNQFGGVPVDQNGNPAVQSGQSVVAKVEGGETSIDSYVFSNKLKDPKTGRKFAKESKRIRNKYSLREDESMSTEAMKAELLGLAKRQDEVQRNKNINQQKESGVGVMAQPAAENEEMRRMAMLRDAEKVSAQQRMQEYMMQQQQARMQQQQGAPQQGAPQQPVPQMPYGGPIDKTGYRATENYPITGGGVVYDPGFKTFNDLNKAMAGSVYNPNGGSDPISQEWYQKQMDLWNAGKDYDKEKVEALQGEMYNLGFYNNIGYDAGTDRGSIVDSTPGARTQDAITKYLAAAKNPGNVARVEPIGQIQPTPGEFSFPQTSKPIVKKDTPPVPDNGVVTQGGTGGGGTKPQILEVEDDGVIKGTGDNPSFTKDYYKDGLRQYSPALGAGLFAGMHQYMNANENGVYYDRVNPDLIDLTRERTAAKREAGSSYNNLQDYIGKTAASGGNAMSNMIAGSAGITGQLGDQVGKSFMTEENANAGILNRANEINANTGRLESDARAAEADAVRSTKDQAMYNMAAYGQQYIQDVNNYATQQDIIGAMGSSDYDYGYIDGSKHRVKQFKGKNGTIIYKDDDGNTVIKNPNNNTYLSPDQYAKLVDGDTTTGTTATTGDANTPIPGVNMNNSPVVAGGTPAAAPPQAPIATPPMPQQGSRAQSIQGRGYLDSSQNDWLNKLYTTGVLDPSMMQGYNFLDEDYMKQTI